MEGVGRPSLPDAHGHLPPKVFSKPDGAESFRTSKQCTCVCLRVKGLWSEEQQVQIIHKPL